MSQTQKTKSPQTGSADLSRLMDSEFEEDCNGIADAGTRRTELSSVVSAMVSPPSGNQKAALVDTPEARRARIEKACAFVTPDIAKKWRGFAADSRPHLTIRVPEDITKCPVMVILKAMCLARVQAGEPLRLTRSRKAPTRYAKAVAELCRGLLPVSSADTPPDALRPETFFAGSGDGTFRAFQYTLAVAEQAEILCMDDGFLDVCFWLSDMEEPGFYENFYLKMMKAWLKPGVKVFDLYGEGKGSFESWWIFFLLYLSEHHDFFEARDAAEAAFPDIRKLAAKTEGETEESICRQIDSAVFEHFVKNFLFVWGFVEVKGNGRSLRGRKPLEIVPTALFYETFVFDEQAKAAVR